MHRPSRSNHLVSEVTASVLDHAVDVRFQLVILAHQLVVRIKRPRRLHKHSRTCIAFANSIINSHWFLFFTLGRYIPEGVKKI